MICSRQPIVVLVWVWEAFNLLSVIDSEMAHLKRDKEKLINRIRRIRGQVDAIEKALEQETEAADMLQLVSACRGALNGLMSELIEGHIRFHVIDPDDNPNSARGRAAQELLDVLKTYLR